MPWKIIFQVVLFLFPWKIRRILLIKAFDFQIVPTAKVGLSLLLVDKLSLGERAVIGHLTVLKGLRLVNVSEDGRLGNLNWITGTPPASSHFLLETFRDPSLIIETHAAITHRHLIDCTDKVTIGQFSTFGGWNSQILTHAIDLREGRQSCAPVIVGSYCFVGTRTVMLKGSRLPDKSVLAAGSVLSQAMDQEKTLYSGVPAKPVRIIEGNYFHRMVGFVM